MNFPTNGGAVEKSMKPLVFIAIAYYEQVWPEVIDAVTRSSTEVVYGPETRIRSSSIDLGRSDLTGRFLEWRGPTGELATHMMCVDADTWWDGDLITRLAEVDTDIICASYRQRVNPFGFNFIFTHGVYSIQGCPKRATLSGPAIEISHTGIGVTLIRRSVIEKMYDDYREELQYRAVEPGIESNTQHDRVHLFQKCLFKLDGYIRAFGEDYGFQWRAIKSGFKIECLTDVTTYHAGVPGNLQKDILDLGLT